MGRQQDFDDKVKEDYVTNAKNIFYFCRRNGMCKEDALFFAKTGLEFETFNSFFEKHLSDELDELKTHITRWIQWRQRMIDSVAVVDDAEGLANKQRIIRFCVEEEIPEQDSVFYCTSGIDFNSFKALYAQWSVILKEEGKVDEFSRPQQAELLSQVKFGIQQWLKNRPVDTN